MHSVRSSVANESIYTKRNDLLCDNLMSYSATMWCVTAVVPISIGIISIVLINNEEICDEIASFT